MDVIKTGCFLCTEQIVSLRKLHRRKERINISLRIECGTNACNKIELWNLFKREITGEKLLAIRYDESPRKMFVLFE